MDASDIAGAFLYKKISKINEEINRIWVYDDLGTLYVIRTFTDYIIASPYYKIDGITSPYYKNDVNIVYILCFQGMITARMYNAILTRIEDIYGMSIEEFSLGQLGYVSI